MIAWCQPEPTEYDSAFSNYILLVDETDMLAGLDTQIDELRSVLGSINETVGNAIHQPYTWTIKQVVGHSIDVERIFAYRACRFAVGDLTELAGFDENLYVANSDFSTVTLEKLTEELVNLRGVNIAMFRRFKSEAWSNSGTAGEKLMTVRAVSALLIGHLRHHLDIIRKRVGC